MVGEPLLEIFRLRPTRAAKVSEISEATASSSIPVEERVNFHIGNPVQEPRLSSAYLRIVLGLDVRHAALRDDDPEALCAALELTDSRSPATRVPPYRHPGQRPLPAKRRIRALDSIAPRAVGDRVARTAAGDPRVRHRHRPADGGRSFFAPEGSSKPCASTSTRFRRISCTAPRGSPPGRWHFLRICRSSQDCGSSSCRRRMMPPWPRSSARRVSRPNRSSSSWERSPASGCEGGFAGPPSLRHSSSWR